MDYRRVFLTVGACLVVIGATVSFIVSPAIIFISEVGPVVPAQDCPSGLQQCGGGCIPKNALCCDGGGGGVNRYCLEPTKGCGSGNCNVCPAGQVFCGMFCQKSGSQCCLGGCPATSTSSGKVPPAVRVDLASVKAIVCTFSRSDLWSAKMPWDGSYVCRGSVSLDFHGLTFPQRRRIVVRMRGASGTGEFSDYYAQANVPMGRVAFAYSTVGGDYFQKNKPPCPAKGLSGVLEVFEAVPDIEDPFPTQYVKVDVPASCG